MPKEITPASDEEVLDDNTNQDDDSLKSDEEILAEDEETPPDEEELTEDEEGKKKEKADEEEEDEEGKKGEDEEDKDLGPRRPSYKEIKTKYPNLFKDFPDLREAFFRESEYTKVFPTVEDARDAIEELNTLSGLRDKIVDGDISVVLDAVKETDTTSYNKLIRNILPTIYKLDQDAFMTAIAPSIENMLRTAYKDGISSEDEDLQNSALHVSKWFFGTPDVATGKSTAVKKDAEPSPEQARLQKERADFEQGKYRDAYNNVINDRDVVMERMILRGLDPEEELTPYVRNKLVKDIIADIDKSLTKDNAHMALMNAKWRRAKQEGYSRDSLKKIVSAYQARAKSLIPSVRARLKSEALGKRVTKTHQNVSDVTKRREVPPGRASSGVVKLPSPREIDWRNTSDADVLSGNIKTLRR